MGYGKSYGSGTDFLEKDDFHKALFDNRKRFTHQHFSRRDG